MCCYGVPAVRYSSCQMEVAAFLCVSLHFLNYEIREVVVKNISIVAYDQSQNGLIVSQSDHKLVMSGLQSPSLKKVYVASFYCFSQIAFCDLFVMPNSRSVITLREQADMLIGKR